MVSLSVFSVIMVWLSDRLLRLSVVGVLVLVVSVVLLGWWVFMSDSEIWLCDRFLMLCVIMFLMVGVSRCRLMLGWYLMNIVVDEGLILLFSGLLVGMIMCMCVVIMLLMLCSVCDSFCDIV